MSTSIFKIQLPPFLLGTAASLYVFTDIIGILARLGHISNKTILQLGSTSLTAIALQLLITAACSRRYNNRTYVNLVAAIFFALNLILFHLILLPKFVSLHIVIKVFIFASVATAIFVVLWKGLPTIITWLTIIAIIASTLTAINTGKEITTLEEIPLSDNYIPNSTTLQHKPNIYLLSFDGLIGQDMFNFHFPADDTESVYVTRLKELDAEIIDNSIADNSTLTTFNRMLAVDYAWWDNLPTELHKRNLLTGRQPSPIYDKLRENGYAISLIYANNFLSRGEKMRL